MDCVTGVDGMGVDASQVASTVAPDTIAVPFTLIGSTGTSYFSAGPALRPNCLC